MDIYRSPENSTFYRLKKKTTDYDGRWTLTIVIPDWSLGSSVLKHKFQTDLSGRLPSTQRNLISLRPHKVAT